MNKRIRELKNHYTIFHKKSTPYYMQANGLTESKNNDPKHPQENHKQKLNQLGLETP